MKNLMWLSMFALLIVSPSFVVANEQVDDSVVSSDEFTDEASGEEVLLENNFGDTWRAKQLGCVNSASSCRKRAYQHGYSHSKIQQDFYCGKILYSCYGW